MAREPSYPEDAPVGDAAAGTSAANVEAGTPAEDGAAEMAPSSRTRNIVTGAAIGIGSAALVAALLYANRSRKGRNEPRAAKPVLDRDD